MTYIKTPLVFPMIKLSMIEVGMPNLKNPMIKK